MGDIELLKQIEINTRGGRGGGGGGKGGDDGGMCGGCGGGGMPGMDACGGGDSKGSEGGNATDGGGMPSDPMAMMTSCLPCGGPSNDPRDGKHQHMRNAGYPGWKVCLGCGPDRQKRCRFCCKMEQGGCCAGIWGDDHDGEWEKWDMYIAGSQKDCVRGTEKDVWNAPNICVGSRICVVIPCKVHIRRCCCCCECACCSCDLGASVVGCQCPCTCIPEDMRCCHCTCGCFPVPCMPVVKALCCGDWEQIQPGDENVPDHLKEPDKVNDICCSCGLPGASKGTKSDS